jgi:hypothetical protein
MLGAVKIGLGPANKKLAFGIGDICLGFSLLFFLCQQNTPMSLSPGSECMKKVDFWEQCKQVWDWFYGEKYPESRDTVPYSHVPIVPCMCVLEC